MEQKEIMSATLGVLLAMIYIYWGFMYFAYCLFFRIREIILFFVCIHVWISELCKYLEIYFQNICDKKGHFMGILFLCIILKINTGIFWIFQIYIVRIINIQSAAINF